jgi:hypothetical protein
MRYGSLTLTLPSNEEYSISQLKMLLRSPKRLDLNEARRQIRRIVKESGLTESDIIFQATSGISRIDAIRENSSSNSQRIGIGICNG